MHPANSDLGHVFGRCDEMIDVDDLGNIYAVDCIYPELKDKILHDYSPTQ